jgi:hypothetical protein
MIKKMLFFVITVLTLFAAENVFAIVITCRYDEYVLKYDSMYHKDIYYFGNDADCFEQPLCFMNVYTNRELLFRINEDLYKSFYDNEKCPDKIYLEQPEMHFLLSSKSNSNESVSYELTFNSIQNSSKVSCGNITGIPKKIPELTSLAITIVHVAVPVILVIMGSLDLFKGITAQKEDEIKKGQQVFVKRLILAALIFFVVVIVKLLISVVADSSNDNISSCIDCFISNDCN